MNYESRIYNNYIIKLLFYKTNFIFSKSNTKNFFTKGIFYAPQYKLLIALKS
jgi:hypothetical protein